MPFKQHLAARWKLYELCFPDLSDGLSFPPHYHDEAEIWSIPPGIRGRIVIENQAYPVEGGVFLYIHPCRIHWCELEFRGRKDICAAHVNVPFLLKMVLSCNYEGNPHDRTALDPLPVAHRRFAPRLHKLFRSLSIIRALRPGVPPRSSQQTTVDSLADIRILANMFLILMREETAGVSPAPHHGMRRVIDLVESRFAEPISLADVATACGFSRSSLCQSFKKATGLTLWHYVNMVRIRHAQTLLDSGGKNVSEACYASGFNDVSHFVKVFKRFSGVTPKKWAGGRKLSTGPANEPS